MSAADRRWLAQAKELQFSQLELARKHAETWRNGLTAVTALLGTVFIVKGRGDVTALHWSVQLAIALLLVVAFGLLVRAVLLALGAAAGEAGGRILLTGEDLRDWTAKEVDRVATDVAMARRFTIVGVSVIALALLTGWLAPAPAAEPKLMQLTYDHGVICGLVTLEPDGYITVNKDPGQAPNRITATARTLVPVSSIHGMTEVSVCQPPAAVPAPSS